MDSKDDFNMTMNWNRTNPWIESGDFKYPLTCCPINKNFNINSKVFNRVLSCTMNGNGIYEMVRRDFISNEKFFLSHLELLSEIN